MQVPKNSKQAFTLIELVVVIAIIGVLTAFAVPNFMAAREHARDAQRKNDLKQLQNAVEMYKLDNGEYPVATTADSKGLYNKMQTTTNICWYNDTTGLEFSTTCPLDKVIYMKKVVRDPNRTTQGGAYYYSSTDTYNYQYILCACLENKADSDGKVANCSDVAGNLYTCTSGKSYTLTEP